MAEDLLSKALQNLLALGLRNPGSRLYRQVALGKRSALKSESPKATQPEIQNAALNTNPTSRHAWTFKYQPT